MKSKNSFATVPTILLIVIFSTFLASQLGKNVWTSTLLTVLFGVIGIAGLVKLRNPVILELGVIGFVGDTVWELYGTGNRLWDYYDSPFYMIGGTLPIEVAVLYFFLGMTAAVYVLHRLGRSTAGRRLLLLVWGYCYLPRASYPTSIAWRAYGRLSLLS
jgi:hypothetical protein